MADPQRIKKPPKKKPEWLYGSFLGMHESDGKLRPVMVNMRFVLDDDRVRYEVRPIGPGEPATPISSTELEVRRFIRNITDITVDLVSPLDSLPPALTPQPSRPAPFEVDDAKLVVCPVCHGEEWEPECYMCDGVGVVTPRVARRRLREESA